MLDELLKTGPEFHENPDITDVNVAEVFVDLPQTYTYAGVTIQHRKPFVLIKFARTNAILAAALVCLLVSPEDLFNDATAYTVRFNETPVVVDSVVAVFTKAVELIRAQNTISILVLDLCMWEYITHLIPVYIQPGKPWDYHLTKLLASVRDNSL